MKIKTSHIIFGLIGLVLLGNGDRIAGSAEQNSQSAAQKTELAFDRKSMLQSARQAQKASGIALERAKAGCVRIYKDPEQTVEGFFKEGEPVFDPINPEQVLSQGFVCNKLGWTGEVIDGEIRNIVMVSPEDRVEYVGYLAMQE